MEVWHYGYLIYGKMTVDAWMDKRNHERATWIEVSIDTQDLWRLDREDVADQLKDEKHTFCSTGGRKDLQV